MSRTDLWGALQAKSQLEFKQSQVLFEGSTRQAVVLAPLLLPHWQSPIEDARLLFIRRSRNLNHHPGQIGFPGGVVEESDETLLAAGFREALEEVRLERVSTRVIGALPHAATPSGFYLHPFFVATTQQEFVAQESEVEEVLLVGLSELLNCPVRYTQKSYNGKIFRVVHFDTSQGCIWGVTGRIVEHLLEHYFEWQAPEGRPT